MIDFFLDSYKNTPLWHIALEFLVFICGILSVWFAKKENIWVYPTGLVATVISVYLLYLAGYIGDMIINGYFSIMSIYGWFQWKKITNGEVLSISRTNLKEKIISVRPIRVKGSPESPISWICGLSPVPEGMEAVGNNLTNIDRSLIYNITPTTQPGCCCCCCVARRTLYGRLIAGC